MATLIWCQQKDVKGFEAKANGNGLVPLVNSMQHERLRSLTSQDCVIQTDLDAMRGVDYKSKDGIILYIARQFPNTRAYNQALGRVGRYIEPCERYLSPDVLQPVDRLEELKLIADLEQMQKSKANKKSPLKMLMDDI